MTRSELAENVLKMLRIESLEQIQILSRIDVSPNELTLVLGNLRRQGFVQLLGSTWRLIPQALERRTFEPIPDAQPDAPRPVAYAFPSAPQPQEVEPDDLPEASPADQPSDEPTEPADMAKTQVCNTCEKRQALTAYGKNNANPDRLQNRCKACESEYKAKRRGSAAPVKRGRPKSTTVVINGPVATPEAIEQIVAAAIAEEPAPLLHATPASEVASANLEIIPVIGALVLQQAAEVDGRRERQAILIPRSDLRSLIDSLTRHV